MKKRKCKLVLALDVREKKEFLRWVDSTRDLVDFYKIGLIPFTSMGPESVRLIKRRKKRVFLDLKFFDIPNTQINASLSAMRLDVDILDFHLLQDASSLRNTVREIKLRASKEKLRLPLLMGVTVLTSVGPDTKIKNVILNLSKKAKHSGLEGVILSGREAAFIRRRMGKNFLLACPGIRLKESGDDQKRVSTPASVKDYADFIIVGRPVVEAKKPREVISRILKDLK